MSIIVSLSSLSANNAGISVGIAVTIIILAALLVSALIVFILYKKNRCFRQAFFPLKKEPVYEIPVAPIGHLARDDSSYTLPPPSTGGEKNGRGPYDENDVYLHEKPSDQEGVI